jgi:hypothetical protein
MLRTTLAEATGAVPEITSLVHDLRNPLSAIHGGAEMLISLRLSEPQVHRIARNLYGASVRMKELLDEVLSRYRGIEGSDERTDVLELVARAVDKIAHGRVRTVPAATGPEQRLHSALGYRPPAEFEQAWLAQQHTGGVACRSSLLAACRRRRLGGGKGALYRETLQATGCYMGRIVIATAEFAPMPSLHLPGYPGGHYSDSHRMRFLRHDGIYQSDGGFLRPKNPSRTTASRRCPGSRTCREGHDLAHRLDEFRPVIPRLGWSPPEPVSASPTRPE